MKTQELENDIPYIDVEAPLAEIRRAKDAGLERVEKFTAVVTDARHNFRKMVLALLFLIIFGTAFMAVASSSSWPGVINLLVGALLVNSVIAVAIGTRYTYKELDILRSRQEVFRHYVGVLSEIAR